MFLRRLAHHHRAELHERFRAALHAVQVDGPHAASAQDHRAPGSAATRTPRPLAAHTVALRDLPRA